MIKFGYGSIGWQKSMTEVSNQIKKLGYEGIEGFGLLDLLPEDRTLPDHLNAIQLQFIGTYFAGSFVEVDRQAQEIDDFRRTCQQVLNWGGHYVAVGGGRLFGENPTDHWDCFIDAVRKMDEVARTMNVDLCFHPHYGTMVFREQEINRFIGDTTPNVKLCLDTGHLMAAGNNVVEVFEKYSDRLGHVHLKDCILRNGSNPFDFVPLGDGDVDLRGVLHVLSRSNYAGWATVELDAVDDPLAAAEKSHQFVQKIVHSG